MGKDKVKEKQTHKAKWQRKRTPVVVEQNVYVRLTSLSISNYFSCLTNVHCPELGHLYIEILAAISAVKCVHSVR